MPDSGGRGAGVDTAFPTRNFHGNETGVSPYQDATEEQGSLTGADDGAGACGRYRLGHHLGQRDTDTDFWQL